MVDFLVRHKLLNPSQNGFLKARSCLTNMLCFLEEITKCLLIFSESFRQSATSKIFNLKLKALGVGDGIID